jgi:assimilatory nitrate reductase catalytic subunit
MLFGRSKKNPIKLPEKQVVEWKYTTCGYCSVGCSIEVGIDKNGKGISARGMAGADVNRGKLCLKGISESDLFNSAGRGDKPLVREHHYDGWQEASWSEALDTTATKIKEIQAKYGCDSFAILSTGQLYTEEFYTLGKLARGLIGSNNYDGNTTLCMASAVSGYKRSFGSDGPPGCYGDFEHTECLMAFGSNLNEQHPIIYWRLKEALEKRKFPVIVVDPRVTMFAQFADIHLPITPGTDVVLLNAMAHVILKEGLADMEYIEAHTNGFDAFKAEVEKWDPTTAAEICGINEDMICTVARLYGKAKAAMSIWTMGINQSTHGSDGVVGINSLNLITGNVGKPGGTSLSITGQCNAMGTREFSSCTGLPAYRHLENEDDRHFMANFWNVDFDFFPEKRGLTHTDIFPAIETGEIKGLWLVATNPLTSMPNAPRTRKMLEKLEFLVVQDCYVDVENNQYSHVYLPGAMWAEKDGCMTNTERRVNKINKVTEPHGDSKPDLWIFNEIAKRFNTEGKVNFPEASEDVFEEMRRVSKGRLVDYSGMNYAKIVANKGLQWPCTEESGEPSPRLYTDGVFQHKDGKAKLIPLPFIDNNEKPDELFPFWLNSGRVIEHFHGRTKTGKVANINKFKPIPYMEMNPDAAKRLGIKQGEYAHVTSRRSDAVVMVQLTQRVAPDAVFIPFHFHECVNRLTLGLLDPYSRQPAYKQGAVKIERAEQQEAAALISKSMRTY